MLEQVKFIATAAFHKVLFHCARHAVLMVWVYLNQVTVVLPGANASTGHTSKTGVSGASSSTRLKQQPFMPEQPMVSGNRTTRALHGRKSLMCLCVWICKCMQLIQISCCAELVTMAAPCTAFIALPIAALHGQL